MGLIGFPVIFIALHAAGAASGCGSQRVDSPTVVVNPKSAGKLAAMEKMAKAAAQSVNVDLRIAAPSAVDYGVPYKVNFDAKNLGKTFVQLPLCGGGELRVDLRDALGKAVPRTNLGKYSLYWENDDPTGARDLSIDLQVLQPGATWHWEFDVASYFVLKPGEYRMSGAVAVFDGFGDLWVKGKVIRLTVRSPR